MIDDYTHYTSDQESKEGRLGCSQSKHAKIEQDRVDLGIEAEEASKVIEEDGVSMILPRWEYVHEKKRAMRDHEK